MVRGERQVAATGEPDQTDDRGAFRVYGLPPGSYYVMATVPEHPDAPFGATAARAYYPGTISLREAVPVSLAPGDEQAIGVTIPASRAGATISGRVVSSTGTPVAAFITLLNEDDLVMGARGRSADADDSGRFAIDSVSPGEFIVDAMVYVGRDPGEMEHAVIPLNVGDRDVTDVAIVTRKAAELRGTLVAAAGSTLPSSFAIGVSVEARGGARSLEMNASLNGSSQFVLAGVTGQGVVSLTNLPEGWRLESIEINGRDVTDTTIDFSAFSGAATMRITITDRVGELNGVVSLRGTPQPATVVVFPDDPARWTYPSRFVRAARADREGRFSITGLPPERRYRVAAVTFLEEDAVQDPEFLQRIRASATEVSLADNETKTIALTPMAR
jgi:hypothetical protein